MFDLFVAIFAPLIIIIAYSYCYYLAEIYKQTADDLKPLVFFTL